MPELPFRLRPSTHDDAEMVARLQERRDPDDLSDPVLVRYWWQMTDELQSSMRKIAAEVVSAPVTASSRRPGDKNRCRNLLLLPRMTFSNLWDPRSLRGKKPGQLFLPT